MLTYPKLLVRLNEIKSMGFVKTHRPGKTGIGKTLEDLLGIKENNVSGPDASRLELKSGRKDVGSMLTLFTKAPRPRKANTVILERYGYSSAKRNHKKELHSTVNALTYNRLKGDSGFKIRIGLNRIELTNEREDILGYWDSKTLQECFERKLPRLLYVKADAKGVGLEEQFWFNEAWLLRGFDFDSFVELLRKGIILVDIRIGQYSNGKTHDHGTAFRVMPNKLELCFSRRKRIM